MWARCSDGSAPRHHLHFSDGGQALEAVPGTDRPHLQAAHPVLRYCAPRAAWAVAIRASAGLLMSHVPSQMAGRRKDVLTIPL